MGIQAYKSMERRSLLESGPLAVALGDPAGIGAEIVLKALARAGLNAPVVLVGCRRWLEEQVWSLPLLDQRSADDILGYGDDGLCG